MTSEKSRIERIIDEINSTNAKKIALLLVLGFACYHGIIHIKYGTNSCKWLLSDGRYKGDQEWQPYGCMLHRYSKIDTRKCLRYIAFYGTNTHFVFIGDDKIRDLYTSFVNHLKPDNNNNNDLLSTTVASLNRVENDLIHIDNKLKIKVEYFSSPYISKMMIDKFQYWAKLEQPPSVIIVGCAFWSIIKSNASQLVLNEYKINLTRLVQPIDRLSEHKTKVLWTLQEPVNTEKLAPDLRMLTNEEIDLYNKAAIEVLYHSTAELWWSIRLVGQGMIQTSPDGIHLAPRALRHDTQILLNMYCNDYMNFNDGTCCSSPEAYTTLQIVTFAILTICVIIAVCMGIYRQIQKWRGYPVYEYTRLPQTETTTSLSSSSTTTTTTTTAPNSYYKLFKSLSIMSLIMFYFIICDRTNFFMKENKYYSEFSFWLPIGYVTILGLFFTEDSKYTKVLHRDQLNEWKGWMQLVVLVYYITGANRILIINMSIKVMIAAYIFLLSYEEFYNVWQRGKNDISIVYFFRKLFQLNFMTVTLCLCMNRPYQFYYFVPLLSFWYLMVYCFLALPPHIIPITSSQLLLHHQQQQQHQQSQQQHQSIPPPLNIDNNNNNYFIQYFYLLIKFIVLFTIITILFMSEVFFEKIFVTRPWKALFVTTDDDIREWWYRWKLDRYSIIYGMGFALVVLLSQRYNIYDDNNHNNLFSRGVALTAILLSIIGIGCYIFFITFVCQNELDCSEIHSYISFIPIVSFIILRNISGILRTRYSTLFAWFGEISLELFISQYHIWLAADTHGVLVLLPGYPVLNVIITTFIFVCASHEIHCLTKTLLPYAVPSDWKCVLRNFILFLAILVPIGINDGMF